MDRISNKIFIVCAVLTSIIIVIIAHYNLIILFPLILILLIFCILYLIFSKKKNELGKKGSELFFRIVLWILATLGIIIVLSIFTQINID